MAPMGGARSAIVSSGGPAIPDVENLQAIYDVQALSEYNDGDTVDPWPDESSNNRDQSANGSPTYRDSELNGYPSIEGDGSEDYNAVTYWGQKQTVYIVYKTTEGSARMGLAGTYKNFSNDVEGVRMLFNDGSDLRLMFGDGSNSGRHGADFNGHADGSARIAVFGYDADNGNISLGVDGSEDTTSGTATLTVSHGDVELLDAGPNENTQFLGHFGEVLMYGTYHNSSTRSDVISHLQNKWGI